MGEEKKTGSTIKVTYNVNRKVFHAWPHSITVNIAQLSFWNHKVNLLIASLEPCAEFCKG